MSLLARLTGFLAPRREADAPAARTAAAPPAAIPVHVVGDPPSVPTASPRADWWRGGVPLEAIDLSHAFEGFRAAPYLCQGGVWTIGYGSTRDATGRPVTRDTPPVTPQQGHDLAVRDLARAAELALAAFPGGLPPRWGAVAVLTSNNMGDMRVWGRTLHAMLTREDWRAAANQLRHYRNADGRPSLGLRRRRWAEAAYALGIDAISARAEAWRQIETADDWPPLP